MTYFELYEKASRMLNNNEITIGEYEKMIKPLEAEVEIVEEAPGAEIGKVGMWKSDRLVSTNGGTYGIRRCSECEAYYLNIGYGWNFCPHCGAMMEVEHE